MLSNGRYARPIGVFGVVARQRSPRRRLHDVIDDGRAGLPCRHLRATVNFIVAVVIVVASTALAIVAMLLVRRRAPEGSYFNDGDRAAGVFGVLATGFAVLLGFVVFLAFTSYDAARSGAETEARIVAQQVETAQLFPADVVDELSGELVCYARSVAGVQWQRMENGTIGEDLNPWAVKLFADSPDRRPPDAEPAGRLQQMARRDGPTGKRLAATGSTAPSA